MKLTIGKKLFGAFLFVLTLLIIESIVSNQVIKFTANSYKQLIDENVKNSLLAKDLENHYFKQSDAVKSYLLTADPTYVSKYREHSHHVNKIIEQMLIAYTEKDDKEVIQQLAAFQSRFQEIANKEIGFKQVEYTVGYTDLLSTSSKTISNVFQGKIDALVKGQELLVQQGSKKSADSIERTRAFVIYLSIFSILIGMTLSFIISQSISKPLHVLAQYTEKIITPKGLINSAFPTIKSNVYEVKQLYQSIKVAFEEIKHHINQLDSEIQTDALTHLANRRTFDLVINEQIENRTSFALIFIDIDFFKRVNDTFGHLVGDDVLRFLAQIMRDLSREGDLSFRYGGEEFAIIVPYGDRDTAISIAERLRIYLEHTPSPTGEVINISLGISIFPDHGQTVNEIIATADEALYQSKSQGRNRTTFYSDSKEKVMSE